LSTFSPRTRNRLISEYFIFGLLGICFLILGYLLVYFTYPGLIFLGYSLHVQITHQDRVISVDEEHKRIILSDDFGKTQVPLDEVRSLIQVPYKEHLVLIRKHDSSIILPRNFSNLQLFKKLGLISQIRYHLGNRVLLKVSRFNLIAYLLLLAIQVAVVVLIFVSVQNVIIRLIPLLILVPTLLSTLKRFLWNPNGYIISDKELVVKTLVGEKRYFNHDLTHGRIDRYFFGGSPYFVIRLHFGKKVFVLDEYYLNTPIYRHRRWISDLWIDKKTNNSKSNN
jgi:hypothetical protein